MEMNSVVYVTAAIGCLSVSLYSKGLSSALICFSYVFAIVIGGIVGVCFVLFQGKKFKPTVKHRHAALLLKTLMVSASNRGTSPTKKQPVIVTRSIDSSLEEVMDLIIADYVMYWLKELVSDPVALEEMLKEDAWAVVQNTRDVLSKIDQVKFITNDITNKICHHYQKIRIASLGDGKESKFLLRPYLQTPETEMEFLRKISEALLVLLLPASYNQCAPVRHLLREILACGVLYPAIELLSDPDYINQKLLNYLLYQQEVLENQKRTYAYAASYEEFIKQIEECTDVDHLKRMRFRIMTEIMQASTISNLKKAKGIDVDKELVPQGAHKGDLLQARNLKKYINQLSLAKTRCEKQLRCIGGPDYISPMSPAMSHPDEQPNIPGRRILPFQVVMESDHSRQYFMKFLEKENAQSVLGFWELLEEMKVVDKKYQHQIGNEVYKTYVSSSIKLDTAVKLEKSLVRGMEAFLIGDKGPEAFFCAQDIVYRHLEQRHYPCFIVSDIFHKMLKEADELGIDFISGFCDQSDEPDGSMDLSENKNVEKILLSDHSSYARDKLEQLDETLRTKIHALQAIKNSYNADSKAVAKQEKKIDVLKQERNQLEYHIERTEIWSENLGKWRVKVHSSEAAAVADREKSLPSFHLTVHQLGKEIDPLVAEQSIHCWSVAKKSVDFMDLHRKLIPMLPWLRHTELPKVCKIPLKTCDKAIVDKAKSSIQNYMNSVMEDEKANRSEILYTFLSPTPELLKQPVVSPKKNKYFFSSFFKGGSNPGQSEGSDEDEFLFMDDDSGLLRDDPIAEPLYALVGEVFDMRGVFKFLRRTLITFVQMTYGRTINRQLRETVSWIFSESMIVYYIHTFRDAMWPNGVLAKPGPVRKEEDRLQTRYQAKKQFLHSIPEILSTLVGSQNGRKGALKVFESLQDVRLNKQLIYELLELFLEDIFSDCKPKPISN